jgi:hypothetical protein
MLAYKSKGALWKTMRFSKFASALFHFLSVGRAVLGAPKTQIEAFPPKGSE